MSWGKLKLDAADVLFSRWIRLRDGKCLKCFKLGSGRLGIDGLQNSHFQGRRKEATRFNELNCCALCPGCHRYFGENPAEHYKWQVFRLGQAVVDQLVVLSNTYCKKDRRGQALYWKLRLKKEFPDAVK